MTCARMRLTPIPIADTMNFENPGGTLPPQQQKHMKNQPCTATAPHSAGNEVASTQMNKPQARNQSVSALIRIPEGSGFWDVGNVLGALSGLPVARACGHRGPYLFVPGVSIGFTYPPEGAEIEIRGHLVGGSKVQTAIYWFDHPRGMNLSHFISTISTPYWLAVGHGLIKAFGGRIKFRSDMPCGHMAYPKPKYLTELALADPYRSYQEELYAAKPITAEQIKEMRSYAAYPDVGR